MRSEREARPGNRPPGETRERRIIRTATEARQGEIILSRRGIWIWIAGFAVILILVLVAAL